MNLSSFIHSWKWASAIAVKINTIITGLGDRQAGWNYFIGFGDYDASKRWADQLRSIYIDKLSQIDSETIRSDLQIISQTYGPRQQAKVSNSD